MKKQKLSKVLLTAVLAIAMTFGSFPALAVTVNSNAVLITVNGTANISAQPTSTAAYVGDPAGFSISATGPALVYQWQYSSDNVTFNDVVGATAATYNAPSVVLGNAGYYRCVITTNSGSGVSLTSDSAQLTVYAAPTVSVMADNTTVNPYPDGNATYPHTMTLTATPSGGQAGTTYTFQWQHSPDNTNWTNINNGDLGASIGTAVLTGDQLSVAQISAADGGYWRCVVTATLP